MTGGRYTIWGVVSAEEVRRLGRSLPRTEERVVRDRLTLRVGRIVYVAIAADEESMGFAFPREERAGMIAAEPEKFFMRAGHDERYQWLRVRLGAIDPAEMRELVVEAWRMVVPKRVAAAYDGAARADEQP
jgi:hypothetical protein